MILDKRRLQGVKQVRGHHPIAAGQSCEYQSGGDW